MDGFAPGGEKNSVTKVASKKGHGIGETLSAAAAVVGDEVGIVGDALQAVSDVKDMKDIAEEVKPQGCCTIS